MEASNQIRASGTAPTRTELQEAVTKLAMNDAVANASLRASSSLGLDREGMLAQLALHMAESKAALLQAEIERAKLGQWPATAVVGYLMSEWKTGGKSADEVCTELFRHFSSAPAIPAQAADALPRWIDDAKGKDPLIDDLIFEIEKLRAALATTPKAMPPTRPMSHARIQAIFLTHGFTIKEGEDDLKPYVYAAAYALLAERSAVILRAIAAIGSRMCNDCSGDACCAPDLRKARDELRSLLEGGA